jgi:ABC-2 type transport system permease protein
MAWSETVLTLRRSEAVLVSLGIPLLVEVFFSLLDVFPAPRGLPEVDFVVPSVLALAVMSTSMVSLGLSTSFERSYGVLKRLGTTPLRPTELLGAKTVSVLAVEVVQMAVLVPVGFGLGWSPAGGASGALAAAGALVLGTAAFASLGLLLAGTVRAEANLGLTNGLYLVLLLVSDMVIPLERMPTALADVARILPSTALAQLVHGALVGTGTRPEAWAVLAAWTAVAAALAAKLFRWE